MFHGNLSLRIRSKRGKKNSNVKVRYRPTIAATRETFCANSEGFPGSKLGM
jgi:hypothetical protein